MPTSESNQKYQIEAALKDFADQPLADAAIALFEVLGYKSKKRLKLSPNNSEQFLVHFGQGRKLNEKAALTDEWKSIDFLFQLTDDEIRTADNQLLLFDSKGVYDGAAIESYLFFTLELKGTQYTRTALAGITRELNKLFSMPVLVLFRHGNTLTLGVINRRLHKREKSRDVLEKITLIKDIQFTSPHRAHIEILFDLSLGALYEKYEFTNFAQLHAGWQKTLDIQTLNKRFFIEVRNWFYWARLHARFPEGAKKDSEGRDSEALIRLLTRVIFCWFLREKGLLPDALFAVRKVQSLLNDWLATDCEGDTAGRYYKAILQNLFFATLATPVAERRFRSPRNYKGTNPHYGDQRYFRHVALFIEKAPVEELYKTIPFLNGGLFENLDEIPGRDPDVETESRVDGFSDVAAKQPLIPDYLFFGHERSVPELCALLGEAASPKARGLLEIFRDYKFTIEENTPLEQDIALDPELLGRAFENLLAAVNPETGATARKSTGSFYTPREIVHYMVEEALVRYLLGALGVDAADASMEEKVRELVSEEQPKHRLNREAKKIVGVLSQLRILDPACGSGAFPMGLLQLLVHVLRKLDPDNAHWKDAKLSVLPPEMRERAEQVFRDESFDYTRKLELIKDCIHGVDIQPAAIQISKLRFFLSLVIEQRDPDRIRPLPNLETKFVCANSLLGLPRSPDWELFQHQIEPKERDILNTRSRYFFARTKEEKDTCKAEDRTLRNDLSKFIRDFCGSTAKQLASEVGKWNPYKPDRRAGYFDPESMFGVRDGFDITIGNPPFVRADEQSEWNQRQRQEILASAQYETLWEKWDLYVPFIERSYKLLRPGGITAFIVSDAFCHSKYAQKPQNWFLRHARILRLDFCSEVKIFDAAVRNIIYFFQHADGAKWKPERRVHHDVFGEVSLLPTHEQSKLTIRMFSPRAEEHDGFSVPTLPIGDICYLSYGLAASSDEKLHKGEFVTEDVTQDSKDLLHPKPWVEGKLLAKWLPLGNRWLEWGTKRAPSHFRRVTFEELYDVPEKILIMRVAGSDLRCCYDTQKLYTNHTSIIAVPWHLLSQVRNNSLKKAARYLGEKPPRPDLPKREVLEANSGRFATKYLLGVMNSSSACIFLRANRRSNTDLYPDDWKKLPIPDVDAEEQAPVVQVVDLLIALTRYFNANPTEQTATDSVQIEFLENLNNALVRELYYPEKLHEKNLFFGKIVSRTLPAKISDIKDASALDAIRKTLQTLTDIKHPLRAALYDLGSLELMEKEVARV